MNIATCTISASTFFMFCVNGCKPKTRRPMATSFDQHNLTCVLLTCVDLHDLHFTPAAHIHFSFRVAIVIIDGLVGNVLYFLCYGHPVRHSIYFEHLVISIVRSKNSVIRMDTNKASSLLKKIAGTSRGFYFKF